MTAPAAAEDFGLLNWFALPICVGMDVALVIKTSNGSLLLQAMRVPDHDRSTLPPVSGRGISQVAVLDATPSKATAPATVGAFSKAIIPLWANVFSRHRHRKIMADA
jgi:hypothetical protein